MESKKPRVLLIGKNERGSSYLSIEMSKRGCACSSACSCREAFLLLSTQKFDLVLSPTSLRDGSLYSLMRLLEGSDTTVFYSCPVEDGFWWLPALRCGRKCFGSIALRRCQFTVLLDETIEEIRSAASAAAENNPPWSFLTDDVAMLESCPRVDFMETGPASVAKQANRAIAGLPAATVAAR